LAIVENGIVVDCFKGYADELNNALFATYSAHYQAFDNHVFQNVPRNIDLKFLRASRIILSYFTKTILRKEVKKVLREDIFEKLICLKFLDFTLLDSRMKGREDVLKSIAFQLGQTIALEKGVEIYTKSNLALQFDALEPFLYRKAEISTSILQDFLNTFIQLLEKRVSQMSIWNEPAKFE
jgi:hypothetical protein